MADIDDRWMRAVKDPDGRPVLDDKGKPVLERTARWGKGLRYAARHRNPGGEQKSKSFATKRDADAFLAKPATERDRGAYIDHLAGRVKIGELVPLWLGSQTSDPSSQAAIALRVEAHIVRPHRDTEVRHLTPTAAQAWIRGLQDAGLSSNYILTLISHFSSLMQYAVDDNRIAQNPFSAKSVRGPKKPRRLVVPWTYEWVAGMRMALPEKDCELITVGAGAGLRQGEALGLAVEDLDWDRQVIHVRRQVKMLDRRRYFALPKGGKARDVPMSDWVAHCLREHMDAHEAATIALPWQSPTGAQVSAKLLFHARGSAIHRDSWLQGPWATARQQVGVPPGRENGFHALRHFFASAALAGGADIRGLATWLGHSDPGFTLRVYAHLMPDSADRMRMAIDGRLAPGWSPQGRPLEG